MEDSRTVAFHVGKYDRSRRLVIDPILSYSTYLGGSNIDGANAIAVAPDKTAFITGGTFSVNFPVAHPLQPNHGGADDFYRDAFVAKISADGSTLLYATYLGGSREDVGNGIAVDALGDAYVIGTTLSDDFPVTPGSLNTECGGDAKCGSSYNSGGLIVSNAFVTKLNPAGTGLVYSTYFGEYEHVHGQGIAVDANQVAYITGSIEANGIPTVTITPPNVGPPPFPITASAFQPTYGGGTTDGFVAKISATGTTVQYSSYLGGDDEEVGYGIVVDSNANAYLTGLTYSTNFPAVNALQPTYGGAGDAFLAKVNTNGSGPSSLLYSTYLGGNGLDQGNGVAVDANGIAYAAGLASAGTFPFATTGTFGGGDADAFAVKIDPTKAGGASLVYFRYLGGSLADSANGIAVAPDPNAPTTFDAYVTGSTVSPDFPIQTGAFQPTYGGGNADAFAAELNSTGTTLVYSSFLGGTNTDTGNGIAVDPTGAAYIAGQTCSEDFPLANPLQATPGGNCDAFISKVEILDGIELNPGGLVFSGQSVGTTSQAQIVTLTNGDATQTVTGITITGTNPGDFAQSNNCLTTLAPGATCTISVTFTPAAAGFRKAQITITDTAPGSPQVLNLSGSTSTLTLSASNLAFGNQHVGVASNALAITATNNGTVPITFSGITASGDFSETDNCTKVALQPTTNCVIDVTYTPTNAGSSVGALTLTDNAPGSPQIILLTGTGFGQQSDFTLTIQPPSATVAAGQAAQYVLTVTSEGGFSQPVTLGCSGLPKSASCEAASTTVTPTPGGATMNISITTGIRAFAPLNPSLRMGPPSAMRIVAGILMLLFITLMTLTLAKRERSKRFAVPALGLAMAMMLLVIACGGNQAGVPSGTPAGDYQVTITGNAGALQHTATVTLQVK